MKARNLTIVTASVAMALMIGSAERAEAHHGWGGEGSRQASPPP